MYNLKETAIPMMVVKMAGGEGIGIDWSPNDVEPLMTSLFKSMTNFLFDKKDRNAKTCIRVQDTEGPLLFAAIVEYIPSEDEEMPGNWSYTFTTSEEEVNSCANNYDIADLVFASTALYTTYHEGLDFAEYVHLHTLFLVHAKCLLEFLDENAVAGKTVDVTIPEIFIASVSVENDEKVISIVPESQLKRGIKDDAAIEK